MDYESSVLVGARDFNDLERMAWELACERAIGLVRKHLENLDRELMAGRPAGLRHVGVKRRKVTTLVGDLEVERRRYVEWDTGRYRYLLDEVLRLPRRSRVSRGVVAEVVELASRQSFREAARRASVAHTTVHRWLGQVGVRWRKEMAVLRKRAFGFGAAVGEGVRQAARLFCEADGVWNSLQREPRRKAEAKLAIVHEGWEKRHPSSREHYLRGKLAYAGLEGTVAFWDTVLVLVLRRWGAAVVRVVSGDGAGWVKKGLDWFPTLRPGDRTLGRTLKQISRFRSRI